MNYNIQMKDAIEVPINKGQLIEYIKDNKRGREDSPKKKWSPYRGKSLKKTIEVVARAKGNDKNNGEEEWHEG